MALSIARPSGKMELQFHAGETRLSSANQVALARQLPRVYLLDVDFMIVEVPYVAARGRGQGTRDQALQRAAAIADFYERAGIPRQRIHTEIKPAHASQPASIEWLGFCKPEREADCATEYVNRPAP